MDATNALGEFLRARRALIRPEEAGIRRGGGLRRVPGLRREEVAMLAGISADYYLRLEQGRDRNPSLQVLEALADVLDLDAPATAHLIGLTQARPSQARRPGRAGDSGRASRKPEPVPPGILQLIEGWPSNPAYVENRFTDVLAANPLATALSPNHSPGVNLIRAILLDESERELRRDWEDLTEAGIAALRANVGPDVDDPRLVELVGELSVRSERFRRLWGRHDVRPKQARVMRLRHPKVGDLELQSNKLAINGTDGLVLKVFHAEPGSRDAELLAILGSLTATGESPDLTGSDEHQAVDEQ
ncbi:transcriptional regulator with XRE-family HTH domain [Streptomyces phaeochromogenes]|uniref:helix-turn-helix transcriptional regulator n=1 Tax=Streptomyces phaeochromogenes TaxID=1923 RepID=UPI002791E2A4|nr:helix-turn-helix transcriptional regulator [Streptomyces phaeochromogenes]MDQ0948278.1 transcriptional regulator with XRE-family HTH domain [Streptomyces phaeochromogenes]